MLIFIVIIMWAGLRSMVDQVLGDLCVRQNRFGNRIDTLNSDLARRPGDVEIVSEHGEDV